MLGVPYPSPKVTMERVRELERGFCGNYQPSYASRRSGEPYVIDGFAGEVKADDGCDALMSIADGVAHTWFHSSSENASWLSEGLADSITNQILAALGEDDTIYPPVTYCASYRNINELERADPSRAINADHAGYDCHFRLGDGIFGALQDYHGDAEFNRLIAQLASRGTSETYADYTIADVRKALGEDSRAAEIINIWYDGQPEMRKYRHSDAVEWTFPPTIDDGYLHFAGKTDPAAAIVHDFVMEDHSYCSQFSLHRGVAGDEWVTNLRNPLPAEWYWREIPQAVAINGAISPETGEFSVTAKIHDNALDGISELSLVVRSRETIGDDGLCMDSESYSQVPVRTGIIPDKLKVTRHYHQDAIEWIEPPMIIHNEIKFTGKAEPGIISLEWEDEYCNQFLLYGLDESGYHFIGSLYPELPEGYRWETIIVAIFAQSIDDDGTFKARASIRLSGRTEVDKYQNLVLVVGTRSSLDKATKECGDYEVLSAVDVLRK